MRLAPALVALAGCHAVFGLEPARDGGTPSDGAAGTDGTPPDGGDDGGGKTEAGPRDASVDPLGCSDPASLVCVRFEDPLGDGLATNEASPSYPAMLTEIGAIARAEEGAAKRSSSSRIQIDSATIADSTTSLTIDLWYSADAASNARQYFVANHEQYELWIDAMGVHCEFWLDFGRISADSVGEPTTNQWHHVACVRDSTRISLYLDGAHLKTVQTSAATINTTGGRPLYIGTDGDLARAFAGGIDDVRILNRVLSPSEIDETYRFE